MKRTLFLSLMMLISMALQAKPKNETANHAAAVNDGVTQQHQEGIAQNTLAVGYGMIVGVKEAVTDKATGKTVITWRSTENSRVKDTCLVKDAPVEQNIKSMLPDYFKRLPDVDQYAQLSWRLAEENGETVLHCYFPMLSDVVRNLWLASEETAIVDLKTGVQYRARRTAPECMGKHLRVEGKAGTVLDLKIYFPALPSTARNIAIYGVPCWYMRGKAIALSGRGNDYDPVPQFHMPRLVKAESNYDRNNAGTWAVYTDAHLIKPLKENTMALWRTPEATYLAFATEQNWMREYYGYGDEGCKLVDQDGYSYQCREVLGYPKSNIFWQEGCSGDFLAIVLVFDPMPLTVSSFTYISPEGKPFEAWGANWSGHVQSDLKVNMLRANQSLFLYHPREIVK